MGAISIEQSETSVEASFSDIHVAEHVAISWPWDYVLCGWCFNRNIKFSRYFQSCTMSSLYSELQMYLPFDSCLIADL